MRLMPPPVSHVVPAARSGMWLALPAPYDVGGSPGTGAGVVLMTERLRAMPLSPGGLVIYPRWIDFPNAAARREPSFEILARTRAAWRADYRPLWLLGDHSLAIGPVRAAASAGRRVCVFQFDAHYDRHERYMAERGYPSDAVNHANVSTYIMREPGVRRLYQIGVRDERTLREIDDGDGDAEVLEGAAILAAPRHARRWISERLDRCMEEGDLIVLTIDLDVLDPSVMPAVNDPEPGGLALDLLQDLAGPVAAAACSIDVCELSPVRDCEGRGSTAAIELLCGLARSSGLSSCDTWRQVLRVAFDDVVAPLDPGIAVLLRGDGACWSLDEVEAAVLRASDVDALRALFHQDVLASACVRMREQLRDYRSPCATHGTDVILHNLGMPS